MLEKHLDAIGTGFGQSDIDNQCRSTNLAAYRSDRPDVGFVRLLGRLSVSGDQLCRTRTVDDQPERKELSALRKLTLGQGQRLVKQPIQVGLRLIRGSLPPRNH